MNSVPGVAANDFLEQIVGIDTGYRDTGLRSRMLDTRLQDECEQIGQMRILYQGLHLASISTF